MEAGSASVATSKVLESEVMRGCLGMWPYSHRGCRLHQQRTHMLHIHTIYSNQHRGVNVTFAQGVGELGWLPTWPGECSSISITLLLLSQETSQEC